MSCYSLDHVIQECMSEKANIITTERGKTTGSKVEIYASSWIALNAWIESRISKHKGANISGFGTFCWEMIEKNNETHCRPLFIPHDIFVKLYRVKRQRIHKSPQLTPVEEVNYSLLAIKYSKTLTKDMIITGIRDLIRKIGEYIIRGYELEIDFTFGTLCAKENRVKFLFNQNRLLEILPENLEPDILAHDLSPMRYTLPREGDEEVFDGGVIEEDGQGGGGNGDGLGDDYDDEYLPVEKSNKQRVALLSLPPLAIKKDTTTKSKAKKNKQQARPSTSAGTMMMKSSSSTSTYNEQQQQQQQRPLSRSMDFTATNSSMGGLVIPRLPLMGTTNQDHTSSMAAMTNMMESAAANPANPATNNNSNNLNNVTMNNNSNKSSTPGDLRAVLDALGTRALKLQKDSWREQAKARVEALAYTRSLADLETTALKDDQRRFEERQQYEAWQNSLQQNQEKNADAQVDLKEALHAQIARHQAALQQQKLDQKNAAVKFILPANAGMNDHSIGVEGGQRISKDLEQQIQRNASQKVQQRKINLYQEKERMQKLSLEAEMQDVLERTMHLEKQKQLLQAWERDGHIRNLQKLQPYGTGLVKDYIDKNLGNNDSSGNSGVQQMTFAPTLSKNLMMSIGYDPRTGKAPN